MCLLRDQFCLKTKTTITTMDDVVVVESDDSENSIIEIEVPRKPTPPLIFIEDEEIILNVQEKTQECILAKDFIEKDQSSLMSKVVVSSRGSSSPNHWTLDMIKFYDDDWGDEEDFVVEKLQEKMDKNPSLWDVSKKDKLKFQGNIRKKNIKCWNCGQRGHHFSLCPDPPHEIKCHMCGTVGHAEYFCPNSICLNCGNHSREYVTCCFKCQNQMNETCSRCQLIGHNFINCPDHWRLFHLTTGTTSIKVPDKNIHKSDKDMWCCNCGRRGHNQVWCNRRKDCGGFMDSFPFVISYERALNFNHSRNKPDNISWKRNKGNNIRADKTKIFRLNSQNKPNKKDKTELKNKLKRFKKNKKSKNNKKVRQRFFDGMLI